MMYERMGGWNETRIAVRAPEAETTTVTDRDGTTNVWIAGRMQGPSAAAFEADVLGEGHLKTEKAAARGG